MSAEKFVEQRHSEARAGSGVKVSRYIYVDTAAKVKDRYIYPSVKVVNEAVCRGAGLCLDHPHPLYPALTSKVLDTR